MSCIFVDIYSSSSMLARGQNEAENGGGDSDSNPPITFTWQNLTVQVEPKTKTSPLKKLKSGKIGDSSKIEENPKIILNKVSGYVKPGSVMAIMGASGAGKSTLLNALTFKNLTGLTVSGHRFANGMEVRADSLTSIAGFVEQDSLLLGALTVLETLIFQARLKMDPRVSGGKRLQRVEEVIKEFALVKCRDVKVGVHGFIKGISGGELKRLAFACQLLNDPQILFCDEPTSGLDSYMAYNVVETLRSLAEAKKKTIICTIHQPSSRVFELFDKVLLMAEGRIAYLGDRTRAESFFKRCGFPCPLHYNLSEHFINTLAMNPADPVESSRIITSICNEYLKSEEGNEVESVVEFEKKQKRGTPRLTSTPVHASIYKASVWQQTSALLWRSWISVIRHPRIVKVGIIQAVISALVIGVVFVNQNYHTQKGAMNVNGAALIMLVQVTHATFFAVMTVFCLERPIFLRERFDGMYRTEIYYACKQLVEAPVFVITPIIFISIFYWIVGFNPDPYRFFLAMLVLILTVQVVVGLGYLISCLSPNIGIALAVAPAVLGVNLLFAGYILNPRTIPVFLRWLEYLSWFKYSYELLLINQWVGVRIECRVKSDGTGCLFADGRQLLEYYGMSEHHVTFDVIMLFILLISFRFLGYLALWAKTVTKKK